MDTTNHDSPEVVLHKWRTTILNVFLTIVAVASAVGTAVSIRDAISNPDQWPVAILFIILEVILIILAVFRKIDYRVRAWGVLLVPYIVGVSNLATFGLGSSGRLFLLAVPIGGLILIGARSGMVMSVIVALTMAAFTIFAKLGLLQQWLVTDRHSLLLSDWIAESTDTWIMLLAIMALLIMFYRFQERTIGRVRRAQTELLRTKALLEEQNTSLEQKVEKRTAELLKSSKIQTALYEITEAASVSRDIQDFYAHIHRIVGELMYAGNILIAIYDEASGLLIFPYFVDEKNEPFPTQPLEDFHGLAGYVIRTGKSIKHGRDEFSQLDASPEEKTEDISIEDCIGAPLIADGNILGAIFVQSYIPGIHYTEQDDEVLAFVGQHIATALTRLRALEAERKRNAELAVLGSVQKGLASRLEMEAIYELVGEKVREIFDAQAVLICTFDIEAGMEIFEYGYEKGQRFFPQPRKYDQVRQEMIHTHEPYWNNHMTPDFLVHMGGTVIEGTGLPKSVIFAPMVVGEEVKGYVSIQNIDRFEAFADSDVRLLTTLTSSMSVALENDRLFDETKRLLKETEQRNAELAIINSVQEGLASKLDVQAIYELIGEKVREVFNVQVVDIVIYDPTANLISMPYSYEKGDRSVIAPREPYGFRLDVINSHGPLLINQNFAELATQHGNLLLTGEWPKSALFVPLLVEGMVKGIISIQDVDRENAFSTSDVRLLQTLANSMSVALENARLFDETQHLLKETKQRNSELAIINSVQQGLASKLDMQAVYDLIGDKIRETFDVQATMIVSFDHEKNLVYRNYAIEKGQRLYIDPLPISKVWAHFISNRQTFLVNNVKDFLAQIDPDFAPPAGHVPKSVLVVPLMVKDEIRGAIDLENLDRENAFDDSDVRLLETLANSMSVALENARLFDETQRLLKETEQRAAELVTVNTVSSALVSELDLSVLIHIVGEQIRSVFKADIAYVALLDKESNVINFPYQWGEQLEPLQFGQGLTSRIIQNGRPLLINQEMERQRQKLGATLVGKQARSFLGVPIFVSGEAIGVVSVQSTTQEGLFTVNDQGLLSTIAANVGVALQNARLFEELKCQQQCAQEAQRRLADIINFLPDATIVISSEGRVIAWNHAIEEMTGIPAQAILGKANYEYAIPFYGERRPILIDLVLLPSEELETKYAHIRRVGGILIGESYTPAMKNGSRFMYATASALHDANGNVVGAIETIRDITERKHTEEELKEAKAVAEQANQAKSAFLAMMSHEIRTPMNAVIGMSGLLLDTPLNTEQREYAETIRNSGDALLAVINDILDFSKIEAGKMDLEHQPFDLRECVESALDLITGRAVEKGLDLAYVFEDDVPAGLCGDVTRLRQVLLNLFSNAVKFTEKGEVVLTVKRGMKKDELFFRVHDTGIGIPPDRMSALFQSFSQADSSTTRKYGGTGLGLAISRRLVEMMGGSIQVESEGVPGKGSTFSFTIQAEPAEVPSRISQKEVDVLRTSFQGKRLLIVDDNPTNRRILHLQTEKWGMAPCETGSPMEALTWLKAGEQFDLAILDMHMPEMNGVELARAIRKLPSGKSLPLAMLSSLGRRESHMEEGDFAVYLHKPLKPSQLFDALIGIFAASVTRESIKPTQPSQFDPELGKRNPLRILLAEDNVVNQKVALRILQQSGYRADIASNGKETLESVARQPYDVILMDVQMPEMDGLEATRQILTRWPTDRPHIIAMTADAMESDREMCLAAGMDDYVAKPIRVAELLEALRKVKARR